MARHQNRANDALRPVSLERARTRHAEGSVLTRFGDTEVLCTASVEERLPPFLRGSKRGWLTAEYGMLPRATNQRTVREAVRGKQSGRTLEIQRLIGRSLRAAVDLTRLPGHTIIVDCDVLQADGGTRTAAITGGYVALADALAHLTARGVLKKSPLVRQVAAISVGIVAGEVRLDLDYREDHDSETDMNIVMDNHLGFIEVQGTAESGSFSAGQLQTMLDYGRRGIDELIVMQDQALAE